MTGRGRLAAIVAPRLVDVRYPKDQEDDFRDANLKLKTARKTMRGVVTSCSSLNHKTGPSSTTTKSTFT